MPPPQSRDRLKAKPGPRSTDKGDPERSLQYEAGVGPAKAARLARLGLRTARDLLFYAPRRFEDRTQFRSIASLAVGEEATIRARVIRVRKSKPRRGPLLLSAKLEDDSGECDVMWFNQRYLAEILAEGMDLVITGKLRLYKDKPQLAPSDYEIIAGPQALQVEMDETDGADGAESSTGATAATTAADLAAGRLVPFYPLTEGLSQRFMRMLAHGVVESTADRIADILPEDVRASRALVGIGEALRNMHFPASEEDRQRARRRLVYEELFVLQIGLAMVRARAKLELSRVFDVSADVDQRIRRRLPFELTPAQGRVISEIAADLARGQPMNRLLQGDVGSGKTAVAVYAMLAVVAGGAQAAVMAPTELLAAQHVRTLSAYLDGSRVRIVSLTGGLEQSERRETLAALASGEAHLVVGTHALLEESVRFKSLGLVVMDEQHKFGVLQRGRLKEKGLSPHVLVMTATPIPRTLALAFYGDLDLSVIDASPPGRGGVETLVVTQKDRGSAYRAVVDRVRQGRQAYVVCPRVVGGGALESFDLEDGPANEIRSAIETRDRLSRGLLKGLSVGLLHGRMDGDEKARVMADFLAGRIQVLVSTVVIEVGIDVPNATALVVEHAERFGLAQLHQLRGRISRGRHRGECYLVADPKTEGAMERLHALEETTDGFKISEADYRIRGPGEFFGTRQSGLPELRFADIFTDTDILIEAREDAFRLVADDPFMGDVKWAGLKRRVADVFVDRLELGGVG
jgi:ATP-dependent DNA helicase RecG